MDKISSNFVNNEEKDWEKVGEGVYRQMLGYNEKLMLVKVKFLEGAIGYLHQHIHSQGTYVLKGLFEVTINNEIKLLKCGDSFFVEPNIEHGVVCIEEGELLDTFSPMRDDFLK